MLWSVVHIFLRSQMLHGFLTCTESSEKFSTGDPPHKAVLVVEDDWYEGMFISKGATRTCIANIWHCNHERAISGETSMTSDQKGILISRAMSYLALLQRDESGGLCEVRVWSANRCRQTPGEKIVFHKHYEDLMGSDACAREGRERKGTASESKRVHG
jgi:hypothetical protein